jgi:CO dehydrogenase/acetyl-CoA synthase alpha subunit
MTDAEWAEMRRQEREEGARTRQEIRQMLEASNAWQAATYALN